MKKLLLVTLISMVGLVQAATNNEIKQELIRQSISSYSGSCPCPYNSARNGSRCGGRSAYSRPGGYSPLCYPSDVTNDMIMKYRNQNN